MAQNASSPAVMRSLLGRARGHGASGSGTALWLGERATSVALVPLTLWFLVSAVGFIGQPRSVVQHWAGNPIVATLLMALVLTTFRHVQLGLHAVFEDYIRDDRLRLLAMLLMKGSTYLVGIAAIIAVLKLAFTG